MQNTPFRTITDEKFSSMLASRSTRTAKHCLSHIFNVLRCSNRSCRSLLVFSSSSNLLYEVRRMVFRENETVTRFISTDLNPDDNAEVISFEVYAYRVQGQDIKLFWLGLLEILEVTIKNLLQTETHTNFFEMSSVTTTDQIDYIEADSPSSPLSENDDEISMEKCNTSTDSLQSESIQTTTSDPVVPTQLTQWVYIQTPPKITMSAPSLNKTNSTNILLNSVAPIQISSLGNNNKTIPLSQPITLPTNQNVILAHPVNKPQHVYIQKPVSMLPVTVSATTAPKNPLTYLTMIKPPQQATTQPKYVITPMPKFTNARLPATVTTNCVQPKIALMPISIHNPLNKPKPNKQKVYNFKITDGQLQTEGKGGITVMCDNKIDNGQPELQYRYNKIICNQIVDVDTTTDKKESIEDKSYELSIVEDSNSTSDVNLSINVPDEKSKIKPHREPPKFQKHGVSILKKNYNIDSKLEKSNSLIISSLSNSITTISDIHTKEIKISTNPNFNSEPPVIIPEPKVLPQKAERRRKSSFTCRKDYDEIIITSESYWNDSKPNKEVVDTFMNGTHSKTTSNDEEEVDTKPIKEEPDINMNEEFDAKKV
ncbi:hypothetical protein FQR65_LT03470 [Abscondita terminalis]|nr:hypothetical protein FQR65_LT03470 [Abscondita terminalis]